FISEDNGASAGDFVTNDSTLVLHGTSASGATVTVTRFGVGVIGSTVADGAGNWSLDYTNASLPNGAALFTATATDSENRPGPQPTPPFRVTIDLIPPAAPAIADIANTGSLVFTGAAEAGSAVSVTQVGAGSVGTATADASGAWALTYSGPALDPGSH